MVSWRDFARDVWRRRAGLPEVGVGARMAPLDELLVSEGSPEFERLMLNRRIMGAFRYGRLGVGGKRDWDRVGDAVRRLEGYRECGDLELLVDVANLCLVEFVEGRHPRRHFGGTDDGEHVREVV